MPQGFGRSEVKKHIRWLIVQHVLVGRPSKEIASWFFCSERTVRRAASRFLEEKCGINEIGGRLIGRPRKYDRAALTVSKTTVFLKDVILKKKKSICSKFFEVVLIPFLMSCVISFLPTSQPMVKETIQLIFQQSIAWLDERDLPGKDSPK